MNRLHQKRTRLKRRTERVRHSIKARHARPRIVFNRTNRFLTAQVIDDSKGVTICSVTTSGKGYTAGPRNNKEAAEKLGEMLAKVAGEKGVSKVVFDRRGRIYHGRIQAFADAARKNGLEF